MTLRADIPVATCEALFGAFDEAAPGALQREIGSALQDAFDTAAAIVLAEAEGGVLHYLDTGTHPFTDLGDWRTLARLPRTATGQLASGARCIGVDLPLTDNALETLRNCAAALGIQAKYPGDAVNALLLASDALRRLSARYAAQAAVKPVIRGRGPDLERIGRVFRFSGMGGVMDSGASVGNTQVWGHNQQRPDDVPLFFIFR